MSYNAIWHKEYYLRNKTKIDANVKIRRENNLRSWTAYFINERNCEVCRREIRFSAGNNKDAIHFDHRINGQELIKGVPSNWLQGHACTKENIRIWELSNFGILCGVCNRSLPTKNREQFVRNVMQYVGIV